MLREELDSTRDICKSLDETNHHITKQLYTGESDKDLVSVPGVRKIKKKIILV